MTGKDSERAAVTDGMRDTSKGALAGLVPPVERGPDVVKCSRAKCNRPTAGGFKQCPKCRATHRDYERRQTAGSKVAKAYFDSLFAKGPAR
jgi:hypothetical protein